MEIRLPRWSEQLQQIAVITDHSIHPLRRVEVSLTNVRLDETDLDGFVANIDLIEIVGSQVSSEHEISELLESVEERHVHAYATTITAENLYDQTFRDNLAQTISTTDAKALVESIHAEHVFDTDKPAPAPLETLNTLRLELLTPVNPTTATLDELEQTVKALNAIGVLTAYLTPKTAQCESFTHTLLRAKENY